jgi:hypothetical protein
MVPMSDVHINVVTRFNRASTDALKIVLASLEEGNVRDEAAIQRLKERISIQERLLAKGQTSLPKSLNH